MIFLPWHRELTIVLIKHYHGTLQNQRCFHRGSGFFSEGMDFNGVRSGKVSFTPCFPQLAYIGQQGPGSYHPIKGRLKEIHKQRLRALLHVS